MELLHDSPFLGSLDPILDRDGTEARVAILKATYSLRDDGRLLIAEEQEPIWPVDQHLGAPGSSVLYESDGGYHKPGTDVVVVGAVYAPKGRPVTSCLCSLTVGQRTKTIQVFGGRHWSYSRVLGITKTDPVPFVEMPLCWERAFGGADPQAGEDVHGWEPRNPIGTGFRLVKRAESLDGLALPNFEDPLHLIASWKDKPAPQGMGFVGRSWSPRRRFAGTYDEAWKKYRRPLPPQDFDYRFFQGAPEDMIHQEYLRGGEPVRAIQLTSRGVEQFLLPEVRVTFHVQSRRRALEVPGVLDTVVFSFAKRRVSLVWRCKYPVSMNEPSDVARAQVWWHDNPGG
jgi:hypothetical protein